jgi:hypothetical protein
MGKAGSGARQHATIRLLRKADQSVARVGELHQGPTHA